jgi:protoporphyrinogen oxidase
LSTYINNYWRGYWVKHPAQCNLYGLPTDLVVDVVRDFIGAQQRRDEARIANYEDWLRASFGDTFAETFPMEYTIKYHTTTASNMNTEWIGPRLYQADLDEVLRGALAPATADVHYISGFRYPTHGGFVSYLKPFERQSDVRLEHEVVHIDPKQRILRFANGRSAPYSDVISSIPLPELIPLVEGAPADVLDAADRLACSEVVIVCLGVNRPDLINAHWTYFYDRDVFFTRLSTPHLQSPETVPPGCGSLQAECYYSRKYRPLDRTPEECIEPVIADLIRCGVLREDDDILFRHAMHIPYANVIFDLECAPAREIVHGFLDDVGIAWCGRYGDWAYIWTDEAFMSGERAAQQVLDRRG